MRAIVIHNNSEDAGTQAELALLASGSSRRSLLTQTPLCGEGTEDFWSLLFLWVWTSFNWLVVIVNCLNDYLRETTISKDRMSWPHILSTITGLKWRLVSKLGIFWEKPKTTTFLIISATVDTFKNVKNTNPQHLSLT